MTTLKPFACTIRVFDPVSGVTTAEHVLPVDSPNAEPAAASTLANAASYTTKMDGMDVRPVAFCCTAIAIRH